MTQARYVLGFAFAPKANAVLLFQKDRPAWQAGRINGVGGKVQPHDPDIYEAMRREFAEETGIHTRAADWRHYARMECPVWRIEVFAHYDLPLHEAQRQAGETETPVTCGIRTLDHPRLLSNIEWLVALALDRGEIHGRPAFTTTRYDSDAP